jgi:hypothetical protein
MENSNGMEFIILLVGECSLATSSIVEKRRGSETIQKGLSI